MKATLSEKPLFYASIKERYRLNHPASQKKTYHIVLDLNGCGASDQVKYSVGDCVAIYPANDKEITARILSQLRASGSEIVYDREGHPHSFGAFLSTKANIARVSSALYALAFEKKGGDSHDNKKISAYLEQYEIWDFLQEHQLVLSPQELVNHLSPIIPRYYSIASSMKHVGCEVHLTVVLTEYESRTTKRVGTCSYFLTHLAPLHEPIIPFYLHIGRDFTLSKEAKDKPIIMIGPGAGVAPFLGFMQERAANNQSKNWLFFGEQRRAYDFYYEKFWNEQIDQKKLKLDLAFSRDQPHKVYVQHKMLENAKELMQWLEEGAFLFVCGDAMKMAKDVDKTLHHIIAEQGHLSEEKAKEYIKKLRKEKRYLRDVY